MNAEPFAVKTSLAIITFVRNRNLTLFIFEVYEEERIKRWIVGTGI